MTHGTLVMSYRERGSLDRPIIRSEFVAADLTETVAAKAQELMTEWGGPVVVFAAIIVRPKGE